MSTKSFATELRDLVRSIRDEQRVEMIRCDNLIAYLDEVINSPDEEVSQVRLEEYKTELQVWVEQNKSRDLYNVEMLRSVLAAGQNALRSAFLMNSGATVALLAFLGKLSEDHQGKIPAFANSMLYSE